MKYRFRRLPTKLIGITMPWYCDRLDDVDGVETIVEIYELGDLVRPKVIHEELGQKKKIYRIKEFKAVLQEKRWPDDKEERYVGVFWAVDIHDLSETKIKFGCEQLQHLTPLERLAAVAPHESIFSGQTE